MSLAADVDLFDCKACDWLWYTTPPVRKYGTVAKPADPTVCPQCGSEDITKR